MVDADRDNKPTFVFNGFLSLASESVRYALKQKERFRLWT